MKKGQRFFCDFLLILALAIPASPVTFVTDTVADSATGNWLNGVHVAYSATCTTSTDVNGWFTLTIPTTEINFSAAPKPAMKFLFDPEKDYFYSGEEKVSVAVFNGNGDLMAGGKLPPGNYFATCRFGSFRFLNIAGQRQSFVFGTSSGMNKGLAKTLAITTAVLTFSKSGYNSKSQTLNVSPATNPRIKLSAIAPAGSSATINIGIAPLDTLSGSAVIP